MGRPRSFEESELLDAVMLSFWRHGYAATTYRSIEASTGVGIRSLANTFGEKDELFAQALARYHKMVALNLATMFDPPSVDAIIRVFERLSSPAGEDDARRAGCLMVNTVFEIDEPVEGITNKIASYRDLWRSTFEQALEADVIARPPARAEFLVGALWGALSQIRLAGEPTAAEPMTSIVIETVRAWRDTN
jgi:TetR/AcrR family transcriptional repressor of nem operon